VHTMHQVRFSSSCTLSLAVRVRSCLPVAGQAIFLRAEAPVPARVADCSVTVRLYSPPCIWARGTLLPCRLQLDQAL